MRTNRRKMINSKVDMNVEYITATGLQVIKTDWVPLLKTKVSVKVIYHFNPTDPTPYAIGLFASSKYEDEGSFSLVSGGDVPGRFYHLEAYNNYLWPKEDPFINITVDDGVLYEFTLDSYGFSINGKNVGTNTRRVYNTSSLILFEKKLTKTTLNVYGIRCWNNGILERDFVPAKRNGIYGLYDKVNKKFWRSSSGVDFLGKDK